MIEGGIGIRLIARILFDVGRQLKEFGVHLVWVLYWQVVVVGRLLGIKQLHFCYF